MRSKAPALLPIFRSQNQARLLAQLYLGPSKEVSLSEVAGTLGVTPGAIHAEVERLVASGLVLDRYVGRTRLLRANTDARAARALTELLTLTFGPELVIAEEFGDLPDVQRVLIYGSWARRYEGETGPEPGDVDVMVLGHPQRDAVYAAAERAEDRLGLPVNPTVRYPSAWQDESDALVVTAKGGAHIVVVEGDAT